MHQHSRLKILTAGILSLIITIGIARFSYTPLLSIMQSETWLNEVAGGWLAAFNYVGYLCGALIAAYVTDLRIKDTLYRLFLLLAVITTFAMPFTQDMVLWSLLRFLSGLSSSGGILLAAALILNWLIRHNYRSELGIHFAGIGLGIVTVSLFIEAMVHLSLDWQQQWLWLSLGAALLSIPAWRWMPRPDITPMTISGEALEDRPPSSLFLGVLLIAYFCAGYGYVISATFLVDIVEKQPVLAGNGQLVFMLVGVAAAPAVILWDHVARRVGYLVALFLAYSLQVIGIIIPALTDSLSGVMISALLFGGTFIGCVSLVLTMAGLFYPTKPAKLMGKMTISYGLAQIIAPALTGWLAHQQGNYVMGIYLAAGFVTIGSALIIILIRIAKNDRSLAAITR